MTCTSVQDTIEEIVSRLSNSQHPTHSDAEHLLEHGLTIYRVSDLMVGSQKLRRFQASYRARNGVTQSVSFQVRPFLAVGPTPLQKLPGHLLEFDNNIFKATVALSDDLPEQDAFLLCSPEPDSPTPYLLVKRA